MYSSIFQDIDNKIEPMMSCSAFAKLYWSFFDELKDNRGTSAGFTGMSELLVFRLVIKMIGGNFEPKRLTKDLKKLDKGDISIRQNEGIPVKGLGDQKTIRPDVSVYVNENLKSIISIKTYLVNSNVFTSEKDKFVKLNIGKNPRIKCLFLSYSKFGKDTERDLDIFAKENSWFRFKSLKYEEELSIGDVVEFILPPCNCTRAHYLSE